MLIHASGQVAVPIWPTPGQLPVRLSSVGLGLVSPGLVVGWLGWWAGLVTRSRAVAYASEYFDSGVFLADLSRRVAFRTESGIAGRRPDLLAYLEQEMVPVAHRLGAAAWITDNPVAGGGPLLIARRDEDPGLLTVLTFGLADVVLAEP